MKRLALAMGALLFIGTFVSSGEAAEPVKVKTAVQVNSEGTTASSVGYRRRIDRRDYRRGYYAPNYGNRYYGGYRGPYYGGGYYGPRYIGGYYYGTGYRGYYGPSYYRGSVGAVNVYPGGVQVGGLNVGW